MDRGRDAGIAAGGAPRQADDARVKPGPAPRYGLILPSSPFPSFVLLLLGACGGGGGGGAPPVVSAPPVVPSSEQRNPPPVLKSISGTLHDGPVWKARVYVDVNRNHQADDGDVLIDPQTDKFGNYEGEIPERYRGVPLVANNENAKHLKGDGSVNEDGTPAESSQLLPQYLGTPAGATVISPLTHIIALWPSMDDPLGQSIQSNPLFTGYDPLQDNIFDAEVDVPYEVLIKEFLVDLTKLIIKHRYRVDLKDAASNLLREYANRVADLLDEVDTPLELARDPDLRVPAEEGPLARLANNLVELRENSHPDTVIYRVAVPGPDVRGNRVHLWLDGADAADFTLTQTGELRLKAAADFETKPRYVVIIRAREVAPDAQPGADGQPAKAGPEVADAEHTVSVVILDADDAPAGFRFQNAVASLAETRDTGTDIRLAGLAVEDEDEDEAFRDHSFTLSDPDRFLVRDGALYLKAGVRLDADTEAVLAVRVTLDGTEHSLDFRLTVSDIHDIAPEFDAVSYGNSVPENSPVGTDLFKATATPEVIDDAEMQPSVSYSLAADDGGALPQWLADLVAIDRATGAVTLSASPDFEALKMIEGLRVDEATGDLPITFRVVATAAHGGRDLSSHSTVTLTVTDVNDEPPRLTPHGLSRATVTENVDMASLLAILVGGSPPQGFRGLQVHDPDTGDRVTLSLAAGKDAALFELVEEGDGRFSLMWKAAANGHRLAPDFERTPANNYRLSHDDDGIFEVELVARDRAGREVRHGFEIEIADDPAEPPSLKAVRTAGQTGPVTGESRDANRLPGATGEVFLGGEDAGNLSLSVEFAHGSAAANPVVLTSVDTPLSIRGRWLFSLERYPDQEYLGPAFRITGDNHPPGGHVFEGVYGKVEVNPFFYSQPFNMLKWTYETFSDYGSGGPFNRLGPGERATEVLKFIIDDGTRQRVETVTLDLVGHHDRPVIVSEMALDNSGNGFSPGPDIAPWPWWQDKFIIQKKDPFHVEQKTVAAAGDGSTAIWRFLAVDEDEGYFKTRETEPGKSDYGPIQAFIEKYIRLLGLDRGRRDAGSFEITQAIDADGNPIFVPLPYDNSMLIRFWNFVSNPPPIYSRDALTRCVCNCWTICAHFLPMSSELKSI